MSIKTYLTALLVFLFIDMIWLGVISREFYNKQIGFLLAPQANFVAAVLFYLLFVAGLVVFVISPALAVGSLEHALLLGAFFGLVTYATYDLTNLATAKDWPVLVTIVDLFWGAFLSGSVSAITFLIVTKLGL